MRYLPVMLAGLTAFPAVAGATVAQPSPSVAYISGTSPENQTMTLSGNNRQVVGRAAVTAATKGIMVQLEVRGFTIGWYGIHITAVGDCSDNVAFVSAGATLARAGEDHGFLNDKGPQQGDFPNLWIGQDGTGRAQFFNPYIAPADLHRPSGSALVIYGTEDDFKSDTTVQRGGRIACGVIASPQPQPGDVVAPPH